MSLFNWPIMSPRNTRGHRHHATHRTWRGYTYAIALIAFTAGGLTSTQDRAMAEQDGVRTGKCDPIEDLLNDQKSPECASGQAASNEPAPGETDADNAMGTRHKIPNAMWQRMNGKSWHRELRCPSRKKLTLLRIPHWNFSYERTEGQMIVAASVANDILKVFAQLYEDGFPIEQMKPVHMFDGNDPKSMAANNTSAFNCRLKTSKRGLSEHSYGKAIDINPIQNPYVSRGGTQPRAGRPFRKNRTRRRKGMIHPGSKVIRAFRKIGWRWGGNWRSVKDYQHFSKSGK